MNAALRLRQARERAGLSLPEAARLAGIEPEAVARIEKPSGIPRALVDAVRLADALGLSLDDLFALGVSQLDERHALFERVAACERILAQIEGTVSP